MPSPLENAVLNDRSKKLVKSSDATLGLFVVGILIVLIIPLPPTLPTGTAVPTTSAIRQSGLSPRLGPSALFIKHRAAPA